MITLQDCIAMCDLDEAEVQAIAEHEHIPEIAAAALAQYLLHQEHGPETDPGHAARRHPCGPGAQRSRPRARAVHGAAPFPVVPPRGGPFRAMMSHAVPLVAKAMPSPQWECRSCAFAQPQMPPMPTMGMAMSSASFFWASDSTAIEALQAALDLLDLLQANGDELLLGVEPLRQRLGAADRRRRRSSCARCGAWPRCG